MIESRDQDPFHEIREAMICFERTLSRLTDDEYLDITIDHQRFCYMNDHTNALFYRFIMGDIG